MPGSIVSSDADIIRRTASDIGRNFPIGALPSGTKTFERRAKARQGVVAALRMRWHRALNE